MNDVSQNPLRKIVDYFDLGAGARVLRSGICAIAALVVLFYHAYERFAGLQSSDSMEYAQLARNLAMGEGFKTQCVKPVEVSYLAKHGRAALLSGEHPDILHPPLYPALLAVLFRFHGCEGPSPHETAAMLESRAIVPLGILFTAGTCLFVFLLGRRLFDARTGLAAMFVYLLGETVLSDSISGLPVPLAAFLASAAVYAAFTASDRLQNERPFLSWFPPFIMSSILCALCFLASYPAIALVPVFILFFAGRLESHRWLLAAAWLLMFGAVTAPWLARNVSVSGNPAGLAPSTMLADSRTYPGDSFYRATTGNTDAAQTIRIARQKLADNFPELYERDLKSAGGGFVLCFFIASFLYAFAREDIRLFRWCLAAGILVMLFAGALYGGSAGRILRIVLPVMCIYGMAFFVSMIEKLDLKDRVVELLILLAMTALTALPTVMTLMRPAKASPSRPYCIAYLCSLTRPGNTIYSDAPWATAWYADRPSALIPATVNEFAALCNKDTSIGGLYLSRRMARTPYAVITTDEDMKTWLPLLNGWIPPDDFPLTMGVRLPSNNDEIFLYRP